MRERIARRVDSTIAKTVEVKKREILPISVFDEMAQGVSCKPEIFSSLSALSAPSPRCIRCCVRQRHSGQHSEHASPGVSPRWRCSASSFLRRASVASLLSLSQVTLVCDLHFTARPAIGMPLSGTLPTGVWTPVSPYTQWDACLPVHSQICTTHTLLSIERFVKSRGLVPERGHGPDIPEIPTDKLVPTAGCRVHSTEPPDPPAFHSTAFDRFESLSQLNVKHRCSH